MREFIESFFVEVINNYFTRAHWISDDFDHLIYSNPE